MLKKLLTFILVAAAVVATVMIVFEREERRLLALYRQAENRLNLKKNAMTVEF